ncbi:MAG: hypothetical protein C5B57_10075 [Blastocatellia bacterium]|nr:MAG: hypothetical protein C5B57_10075 [Blastocatellia bacterium]
MVNRAEYTASRRILDLRRGCDEAEAFPAERPKLMREPMRWFDQPFWLIFVRCGESSEGVSILPRRPKLKTTRKWACYPGQPESGLSGPIIHHLRRALWILGTLAAAWATAVALTGGFALFVYGVRFSSRTPRPAVVASLLSFVLAWILLPHTDKRRVVLTSLRYVVRPPRWLAPAAVLVASAAIVAVGVLKGAHAVGGADSYGYVSQAELWATGTLRISQPFTREMKWPFAPETVAPLGYRPVPHRTELVPMYAAGLPIVMAIFERLGGREAVFFVVPFLGGLAIWATYVMGRRVSGRTAGVAAAVLLATSPVFIYQLMFPMSDVPAAAWWALMLTLLLFERRDAALAAGVAAGFAILTRPNLVPLTVVPAMALVWRAMRDRSVVGPAAQRAALFVAGIIPACLGVAVLNTLWYGSPLDSGYGGFSELYQWENFSANLTRYPRWLVESETPTVLLALAAPLVVSQQEPVDTPSAIGSPRTIAIVALCFIAVVLGCYAFYIPFDAWWYLRFLLPAFPPLAVLTGVAIAGIVDRVAGGMRIPLTAVLVATVAWHGVRFSIEHNAFGFREAERKYLAVGEYIAKRLPERAAVISMQHSGSVRYYSGRLTIRYDWITPTRLDTVVEDLRGLGYQPYFLLENWEAANFQRRFSEHSALGALDWPPMARLDHPADVKIFDPADRDSARRREVVTDIIH